MLSPIICPCSRNCLSGIASQSVLIRFKDTINGRRHLNTAGYNLKFLLVKPKPSRLYGRKPLPRPKRRKGENLGTYSRRAVGHRCAGRGRQAKPSRACIQLLSGLPMVRSCCRHSLTWVSSVAQTLHHLYGYYSPICSGRAHSEWPAERLAECAWPTRPICQDVACRSICRMGLLVTNGGHALTHAM